MEEQRNLGVARKTVPTGKKKNNRKTILGLRGTIQSCKNEERQILLILADNVKNPHLSSNQKIVYDRRYCELVNETIPKLEDELRGLMKKKRK